MYNLVVVWLMGGLALGGVTIPSGSLSQCQALATVTMVRHANGVDVGASCMPVSQGSQS